MCNTGTVLSGLLVMYTSSRNAYSLSVGRVLSQRIQPRHQGVTLLPTLALPHVLPHAAPPSS